jgi:hypothetical protein
MRAAVDSCECDPIYLALNLKMIDDTSSFDWDSVATAAIYLLHIYKAHQTQESPPDFCEI